MRHNTLARIALLMRVLVVVFLVGASCPATASLYSYDPAQTYGGHSWSTTHDALASSFTLPTGSASYSLDELRIRISYTSEPITPITVSVWDDDAGQPGALIWSQSEADVNGPTTDAASYWWWNAIDMQSAPAIAGGSTIFVGYSSASFADIAPSWSANTSLDGIQGSWYRDQSSSAWSYKTYDRMMQLDVVPEPSSLVVFGGLFGMGLIGFWTRRRRAN